MKSNDVSLKAVNVANGEWFYVTRTKQWLKKTKNGKEYVHASVLGNNKVYLIPPYEEVEIQAK